MIRTIITDKNKRPAEYEEGRQIVSMYTCPPLMPQKNQIFSQFFTVDGTASGSNDLGVSGAVTPVEYYIPAHEDNDRYITRLSFVLGYGSAGELFEFADSTAALINGVKLAYNRTDGTEIEIANPKSNFSFHRLSGIQIGHNTWEDRNFGVNGSYGYFINVSMSDMMPPYGIKLDRGTNQRMVITIRDDCTDADLFNCKAFGFERFE